MDISPMLKDEEKTQDELIREVRALRRIVASLEAVRGDLREAEEKAVNQTRELAERIKELDCLYKISNLFVDKSRSMGEIVQGTMNLLPPALQYPEITCVRIRLGEREFQTENFRETPWRLDQDIMAYGKPSGSVEVFYLQEKLRRDEGPFLKEERQLINAVAERLGRIQELKWAEEALRESEESLRSLVYSMEDFVFVIDDQGRFKSYHQPEDKRDLYVPPDEFLGKTFQEVLPRDVSAPLERAIEEIKAGGRTRQFEYVLQMDGRERWYEAKISPIGAVPAGFRGVTVVARDITERKRMERALVEQERLKTIGALSAEVAHEIRNPIVSIGGFARRLHQRFPEVQEAEIILREAERLERMLERIWQAELDTGSRVD